MQRTLVAILLVVTASSLYVSIVADAFGLSSTVAFSSPFTRLSIPPSRTSSTILYMSDAGGGGTERERKTKKGISTIVKDRVETKQKEDIKEEEMWRVLLHNDEIHTFQYVTQSLVKVIGTLDRKTAFEICVQTHNSGKATVTKTWRKQAEKFCLGMQRQGLTASIAPDKRFKGGGKGGDSKGGNKGE